MKRQAHVDAQIEALAKAHDLSIEEAAKQFMKNSEYVLDFDNLPKQQHNWTDRGLKLTCENAGHPFHEAWKARKPSI